MNWHHLGIDLSPACPESMDSFLVEGWAYEVSSISENEVLSIASTFLTGYGTQRKLESIG